MLVADPAFHPEEINQLCQMQALNSFIFLPNYLLTFSSREQLPQLYSKGSLVILKGFLLVLEERHDQI